MRYTDESKDFSQSVINDAGKTIFLPVNPITGATDTSNTAVPEPGVQQPAERGHVLHLQDQLQGMVAAR